MHAYFWGCVKCVGHMWAHASAEMSILVFLSDLQSQLDSHIFFSCFYGRAGREDGSVYKALLLSFCLDYIHVPYNSKEVNHTRPPSIVRISPLL